jgi:hypothetical protein
MAKKELNAAEKKKYTDSHGPDVRVDAKRKY